MSRWLTKLRLRVRSLVRRTSVEQELNEEMQYHFDRQVEEHLSAGMTPEEARTAARRALGPISQSMEECRDIRRIDLIENLTRDLRFAVRMLRKQPGFTLVALLALALGIGATSAVFSLIQGVLWTPPPYRDPQQLVLVPPVRTDGQQERLPRGWPAEQWLEWQQEAKSFGSIAAYSWRFNFLVRPGSTESMQGMGVTSEYFSTLGLRPYLGRTFLASETQPGRAPASVIILGYDFWQHAFSGDPEILGKTVPMSRRETPPTIVGVMPPGVRFLPSPDDAQEPNYDVNARVDYWLPSVPHPERLKNPNWNIVGRLRPGATAERAQAELTVLSERQAEADNDFAGVIPRVQSLQEVSNRDGRSILFPLFGASALVLLIACGNAAALLLVRGLQRQQEYAVRGALGVSKAALLRQAAAESLVLAVGSGALGVLLAVGIVRVVQAIAGHAIPRLDSVVVGWPVLAWALGAAGFATVLAGLAPAMRAARLDPMLALKNAGPKSSADRGDRRWLRAVTMAQTALTIVLLVGAGLLVRTMMNLAQVESGYNANRVLTMSVTAFEGAWENFHRGAVERVAELPGVEHAAFAWGLPLTGNNWPAAIEIEGQPAPRRESDRIRMPLRSVTPDYFELLGLDIIEGRDFRASDDRESKNVAVVNQAFVDRYFPGSPPIGRKLWLRGRDQPPSDVIGVVENGRTDDLTQEATPEIYLSLWQNRAFSKHFVVRTTSEPDTLAATIQSALREVEPTVAIEHVKTLGEIRGDSLASRTFAMQLLMGFAFAASVLTLVGIYGVLALAVASRRRELAIRAAVGARRQDIRALVFGEGFRLIGWGVLAGLVGAISLSRVLRSFLFEVDPNDPLTLGVVVLLFGGIASLACWAPTRRAVRVNPADALRAD